MAAAKVAADVAASAATVAAPKVAEMGAVVTVVAATVAGRTPKGRVVVDVMVVRAKAELTTAVKGATSRATTKPARPAQSAANATATVTAGKLPPPQRKTR